VNTEIETCEVKKGEFCIELVEEGEILATHSINISSPAMSWQFGLLKITQIVEDGAKVNIGDTVIMFDPSEVQKAILDAEAELEIAKAELEKMRAQHSSKIEELKANIQISEISHQISEIKLEQATFESDITRKEISLNLDKAGISLDKAREEIVNQEKIHREEIQQSLLKIRQLGTNLSEAQTTLKNLVVVSPAPGIAIIRKNWATGNKWQVGDQPWSGNPMIDLPDLGELKVEAEISEVDIAKISLGLEAEIKLDAFSDTVYKGKVISVANLAQFKEKDSKIKVFPVEVLIDGTSDVFLPGMTVSCRIIVNRIEDVLYIPLESMFLMENDRFVFVKSGGSFERKQIKTKEKNNDYIVVQDGLEEGELIAMADPFPEESIQTKPK
jgi:multidrug efflux pump subunit AcrA (membrane-fusion protein)